MISPSIRNVSDFNIYRELCFGDQAKVWLGRDFVKGAVRIQGQTTPLKPYLENNDCKYNN